MARLFSIALVLAVAAGCSRAAEEHPTPPPADASTAAATSAGSASSLTPSIRAAMQPPEAGPGIPMPSREPDWDLDPDDKARDYVVRYIRATERYADKTPCVTVMPSTESGDRRAVAVKDDPKSPCFAGGGAQDAPRDVFLVDVGADRLSVDDPKTRQALRKWPDGSDPEGPAAPVAAMDNGSKKMKGPLRDALAALQQVPLRVQMYGRGTYPVFTIAGFHPPALTRDGSPSTMHDAAQKLCAVTHDEPLGIFGGMDRTLLLRVRCRGAGPQSPPGPTVAWETF